MCVPSCLKVALELRRNFHRSRLSDRKLTFAVPQQTSKISVHSIECDDGSGGDHRENPRCLGDHDAGNLTECWPVNDTPNVLDAYTLPDFPGSPHSPQGLSMVFSGSRRWGVECVLCGLGRAVHRAQGPGFVELVVSRWWRFCLKEPRVRRKSNVQRDLLTTCARLEARSLLAAFVVTSAADNTTASDGLTTLREAIIAANAAGAGPHTITFGNGSATLGGTDFTDTTPDTITLSLGEMEITESLTITGQSAANTIIDGNNASRMFSITSGDTTLEKLTLTRGRTSAIGGAGRGGAIRSTSTGAVTLNQCTLSGKYT